ncbi:tyrosine-protein phosphatase [Blastomonas sp.]|uniref:tyrosine-protein phosphatase n=1 Tax=Blastomonas sp. TaxID=1909299 RepID=UPI0026231420|nr:tyrosine-protein phosphatase [Blastomonas sp.]MDM7956668.1 tyrosine-protein phosphatase [Blastomonas sp.]
MVRVLVCDGISNFRDYGDYPARAGARIAAGRLYRSGHHVHATPSDIAIVARLALATVIDLRGSSERELYPCRRPENFEARVLFADGETTASGQAPHDEAARAVITAHDAHANMLRLYAEMPFQQNMVAAMRLYFAALAERDGASLLHCLAGKDRTGMAAALLHSLLGVHEDEIVDDYLLTNVVADIDARMEQRAPILRTRFGSAMHDDAVRTLMSVHPDYLERSFAAMIDAHGSVSAYARTVLGVTDRLIGRIEDQLLV